MKMGIRTCTTKSGSSSHYFRCFVDGFDPQVDDNFFPWIRPRIQRRTEERVTETDFRDPEFRVAACNKRRKKRFRRGVEGFDCHRKRLPARSVNLEGIKVAKDTQILFWNIQTLWRVLDVLLYTSMSGVEKCEVVACQIGDGVFGGGDGF